MMKHKCKKSTVNYLVQENLIDSYLKFFKLHASTFIGLTL